MVHTVSLRKGIELARQWAGKRGSGSAGRFHGGLEFLLLSGLLNGLDRPCLVVTRSAEGVDVLREQLEFSLGEEEKSTLSRRIFCLPSWDALPLSETSPHPEAVALRVEGLFQLLNARNPIVVTGPEALMQRVISKERLRSTPLYLVERDELELETLLGQAIAMGYRRTPLVTELGQVSVRGGIVDIYPPGYPLPARIEMDGDRVESIRSFDPSTQRSRAEVGEALILPLSELYANPDEASEISKRILDRSRDLDLSREKRAVWAGAAALGALPSGADFLLPYFAGPLIAPFAYLPADMLVVRLDPELQESRVEDFSLQVEAGIDRAKADRRLYPEARDLYLTPAEWRQWMGKFDQILIGGYEAPPETSGENVVRIASEKNPMFHPEIALRRREQSSVSGVVSFFEQRLREDWRVVVAVQDEGKIRIWRDLFEEFGLPFSTRNRLELGDLEAATPGLFVVRCPLSAGVLLPHDRVAIVTHEEVFGGRRVKRRRAKTDPKLFLTSLSQLKEGDLVVHADYGVGLYRGLKHLSLGGSAGDFLHLEYDEGDKLYLPVDRINLVQKYAGADGDGRSLDRLGGVSWEKLKKRTKESILAMAKELAEVYAARELSEKQALPAPDVTFHAFEEGFEFEETPDQAKTIEEVMADLQRDKPMDRLVCGDVGFGKTEVAIRAAFHVVMNGKQAALLAPTTVLARQHWKTLSDRFSGYPIRVELLSRFNRSEEKAILPEIAAGKVDVVVGTHRLLQDDVVFKDLGLLVVDEEHRFGVAHKEKIRRLRPDIDTLTLTATPIPRTLHMSLSMIRDLSVIATPPPDRLSVRTYVCPYRDSLIRDAITRELGRGGQVFFVHNRVQTIHEMARKLSELVPEASIAVGHGELPARALEKVMSDFLEGKVNVLVCSTIIESGLDIPNANTLIVNRADRFGLAELYQLRGRVGRSSRLAYAYLLTPTEARISERAELRLRALQELDDLGGGFRLAMHDLENRGAGNLLGRQQSGHIAAVGFELYTEMVESTIKELMGQKVEAKIEPEISVGVLAYLPDAYIPDMNQRLFFYQRLASVTSEAEVGELREELKDRYGPLPAEAESLLEVMRLRSTLKALRITRLRYKEGLLSVQFHPDCPIPPEKFIRLVERKKEKARVLPDMTLLFAASSDNGGILSETRELLGEFRSLCEPS